MNTLDPIQFFGICFAILSLVLWLNVRLVKSPFGLALNAARQSPERVEAVGLDPFRLRLIALVISGMICGLAGALFADLNRFVSPTMFSWQMSGELIVFIVLGGLGRTFGPVAGATLFVVLEHALGGISEYFLFFLGLLLLVVVLFARGGLYGVITGRSDR
jgi:branched-chain amino acid transport system permease protein